MRWATGAYVGRHAGTRPPSGAATSPAELLGWAVFCALLVAGVLLWVGVPVGVVVGVGVVVLLALGSVAALARFGSGARGRRPPPGPPDGPPPPPRVP
jgi:Flp pilus assembly protein TadB